jgi:glycosyltransferase involved in cell wall biosynthesis
MKISIYNEQDVGDVGGSEFCMAVLAEALSGSHGVDLVNHTSTSGFKDKLAKFMGTDLSAVRHRYIESEYNPHAGPESGWFHVERKSATYSRNPWRRYQQARAWHAGASDHYDLFINFAHFMPPFCHARKGVLVVLFPRHDYLDTEPLVDDQRPRVGALERRLLGWYRAWEWQQRIRSYHWKAAISQFTSAWSRRRWGINCRILNPPVDTRFGVAEKRNLILSVGRFVSWHTMKKQVETVTAFGELVKEGLQGWAYFCVGGLGNVHEDIAYFETARGLGDAYGAHVLANIERDHVRTLCQQAKIFWHAAGLGLDERAIPEASEHFGITTVEAMAAGCVPVVINKGGQPEIVEHGVSGFVWNTLEEMKHYTRLLIRDDSLHAKMSAAARLRAQYFSRENFVKRFLTLVGPWLR